MLLKLRHQKKMAMCTLVALCLQFAFPVVSSALTGGPTAPEYSGFKAFSTEGMVNAFDGSFSYQLPVLTVPGPQGSSYPVNLTYNSGVTPESQASWVGLGWSLNPGAVNRQKNGIPDDVNGDAINYRSKNPSVVTASIGLAVKPEAFSVDIAQAGASARIQYNSVNGFSFPYGLSVDFDNTASLGFNVDRGSSSFSARVNPGKFFEDKKPDEQNGDESTSSFWESSANFVSQYGVNTVIDYGADSRSRIYNTASPKSYFGTSTQLSFEVNTPTTVLPVAIETGKTGSFSTQQSVDNETRDAYGYMYSVNALGDEDSQMDYYLERESGFTPRNNFLGTPFSNADQFMVSGQAVQGSFRLHHTNVGHYRPTSSSGEILNIGVTVPSPNVGGTVGVGTNINLGGRFMGFGSWLWIQPYQKFLFGQNRSDQAFFRFNNDVAGSVIYDVEGKGTPIRADMNNQISTYTVDLSGIDGTGEFIGNQRPHTGKFVDYHTFGELYPSEQEVLPEGGTGEIIYTLDEALSFGRSNDQFISESRRNTLHDRIAELAVYNEQGQTYVYAEPVLSRNDRTLRYGFHEVKPEDVLDNYLIKNSGGTENVKSVNGQEARFEYASSFLLTEVFQPGYVDRTLDGPTEDDLGGYTKFTYTESTSLASNDWFRWRIPTAGYVLDRGSLSDDSDDVGTVSGGERQVKHLETIETKTHIAYFITNKTNQTITQFVNGKKTKVSLQGSGVERHDGYGALLESEAGATLDKSMANESNSNYQRRLEEIRLYKKNPNGPGVTELVQSAHFEYSESTAEDLMSGLFTSKSGRGHLTLKKVWFEHGGVKNHTISPYEFSYKYPQVNYPAKFAHLVHTSTQDENPAYSRHNADKWGYYTKDGKERRDQGREWVDQQPDLSTFDPAAWHLKAVKLPSGGEIHVQYEQKTYSYVQDRRARLAFPLESYDESTGSIIIDPSEHFSLDPAEMDSWAKQLKGEIVGDFIQYKILFKLSITDGVSQDNFVPGQELRDCNAEYISGFAKVEDVKYENLKIKIILTDEADKSYLPHELCEQFYETKRVGNVSGIDNCDPETAGISVDDFGSTSFGIYFSMVSALEDVLTLSQSQGWSDISLDKSFLSLPIPAHEDKIGGGIRVKRVLLYDPSGGLGYTGEGRLYGTEYEYVLEDGRTSGVATSEPAGASVENVLKEFLRAKESQNIVDLIGNGEDMEQRTGPIGESVLPAASVGYSRVVSKNIFQADNRINETVNSSEGFVVSEFFTAKDFPFDGRIESLNSDAVSWTPIRKRGIWFASPTPFGTFRISKDYATQGFQIIENNMHGQPKSKSTYGGTYLDRDTWFQASRSEYEYFNPGEKQLVIMEDGSLIEEELGVEQEIVMESRATSDVSINASVEIDISLSFVPALPFVIPVISGSPDLENIGVVEEASGQHSITKILKYPPRVKRVTSYVDGIYSVAENVGYNRITGEPVVVRSVNSYDGINTLNDPDVDGSRYSYKIEAPSEYSEMGAKSQNQGLVLGDDILSSARIVKFFDGEKHWMSYAYATTAESGSCEFGSKLTIGDILKIKKSSGGTPLGYFVVTDILGSYVSLVPVSETSVNPKAQENVIVEVIKSGYSNQLSAEIGNFVRVKSEDNVFIPESGVIPPTPPTIVPVNQSLLSGRAAFVSELNKAIVEMNPVVGDWQSPVTIIGADGKCSLLESQDIELQFDGPGVTVKYKIHETPPYQIPSDHQIVEDLNQWLNSLWLIEVQDYLDNPLDQYLCTGFDDVLDEHTYSTHTLSTSNRDLTDELTGMQRILDTYYWIYDASQSTYVRKKGSQLVNRDLALGADVSAIMSKRIPKDDSEQQVYLSTQRLRFIGTAMEDNFGFTRHTQTYAPNQSNNPADNCQDFWIIDTDPMLPGTDPNPVSTKCYIDHPGPNGLQFFDSYPTADENNVAMMQFILDHPVYTESIGKFEVSSQGELVYRELDTEVYGSQLETHTALQLYSSTDYIQEPTYCVTYYCQRGDAATPNTFGLDEDGELVYLLGCSDCTPVQRSCIDFCENYATRYEYDGVVSASASVLSSDWVPEGSSSEHAFVSGEKGIWRQKSAYVYDEETKSVFSNYGAHEGLGMFTSAYKHFVWDPIEANFNQGDENWLQTNSINKYNSNGGVEEQTNLLGVPSAAIYDTENKLVVASAQNAQRSQIAFSSFEGQLFSSSGGHTGSRALLLDVATPIAPVFEELSAQGLEQSDYVDIRFWACHNYNVDGSGDFISAKDEQDPVVLVNIPESTQGLYQPTWLAQSGKWSQYRVLVPASELPVSSNYSLEMNLNLAVTNQVHVDDVRVSPASASISCYVYEYETDRLLAQLDDQHFAVLYAYTAEGKLKRIRRETERGIRTISETNYNTPAVERVPLVAEIRSQPGGIFMMPSESELDFIKRAKRSQMNADRAASEQTETDDILNVKEEILDIRVTPDSTNVEHILSPKNLESESEPDSK